MMRFAKRAHRRRLFRELSGCACSGTVLRGLLRIGAGGWQPAQVATWRLATSSGKAMSSMATESSSKALPGRVDSHAAATVMHHTQPPSSKAAQAARPLPNIWIQVPMKGITRNNVGTNLKMRSKPRTRRKKPSNCRTKWTNCCDSSARANIWASVTRDSSSSYTSSEDSTRAPMFLQALQQQLQQPPSRDRLRRASPSNPGPLAAASSTPAVDALSSSNGSRPASGRTTRPPRTLIA
mmetsp:Transcript_55737/g.146597  ORF Transcript_55737/g.146597 Transcript_55737/m.146597 type:complete len:238 (-) Transcript_55737:965-1678(-)